MSMPQYNLFNIRQQKLEQFQEEEETVESIFLLSHRWFMVQIVFIRPGQSQGLLYKHRRHSFINSLILSVTLCPPHSRKRHQA